MSFQDDPLRQILTERQHLHLAITVNKINMILDTVLALRVSCAPVHHQSRKSRHMKSEGRTQDGGIRKNKK